MSRPFGISGISIGSNGEIIFNTGLVLPPAITVNISANTNNLSVPTLSSGVLMRFNNSGNNNLTGIIPPDITQGNLLYIANVGSGQLTIMDNDPLSSANNRFLCGGNKVMQANEAMIFVYDTISLRWRSFAVII
jgi:hypothetical protein